MRTVLLISWRLVALALACAPGIVPSCASMGGGGMRYDLLSDPPFYLRGNDFVTVREREAGLAEARLLRAT